MPYTEHLAADYRIFIRRHKLGRKAHLYVFSVRQAIPTFPLPLLPGALEPPAFDLGAILQDLYDRARYKLAIDYTHTAPALTDADAVWAADCLATPLTAKIPLNPSNSRIK